MRLRKQISETDAQIAAERAKLAELQASVGPADEALAAAQRRQPAVNSLVGFLVGVREQNGFGEAFRITALTRSDVQERHA